MRNIILILLFFVLTTGCAHHYRVGTSECINLSLASEQTWEDAIVIEKTFWSLFQFREARYIEIEDVLKEYELSCYGVDSLSYQLSKRWDDVLISFLPFVSRRRLGVILAD